MSNNTVLNPGQLGDTIATEDISGVKYERVKLIDSTVGSTSPIGVAANPLKVEVSSAVAAGGNTIGNVKLTDGAGIVNTKQLGTQLTTADVGLVTNTIIHGVTTGGGGGYVDVKVTPSGALNVAATQDGTWSNVGVITGSLSTANSSTATLSAGATWTGTGESVVGYASVTCAVITDQAGTLYLEFSPDNTNWDGSLSYSVAAGTNEVHRLSVTRRYFRARFTNTAGSAQTYFRLQSLLGTQPPLTSALNSTVQSDADSLVTRSVLMGQTDDGNFRFVPVDAVGHLEVNLAAPRLPFGSVHTEGMTPIFQTDSVYGINSGQVFATTSGSGSATASNGMFVCSTGATVGSQAVIQSRKRLRYRPGQGFIARFTGIFDPPVANSYQLAGIGHSEDGAYFGYGNTSDLTDTRFGILYVHHGVRETRTLTVTTGATSASNCTITLNGTAYTVALTAASNVQRTVWEISQATYTGWDAYPAGATVVFVRQSAGAASGTYSFGAGTTGAAATIAQTKAGVASTDTFIPQSTWNGDKLDGTGASGVTIDPTKGNVFQIDLQYLGFGVTVFKAEVATSNGNTQFVVVHTIRNPNAATANWDINQIEISGLSESSAGAISESARDIAQIRAVTKISVSELSRVFGVSRQAVHEWIKGGTLSPRNAQRLSELARATDVFLEAEIETSPQVFRRKIAGGQSILDAVRENGNVVELAKTLATTLVRESQQRQRLAARLAGRSATPDTSTEFGSPHLDEDA